MLFISYRRYDTITPTGLPCHREPSNVLMSMTRPKTIKVHLKMNINNLQLHRESSCICDTVVWVAHKTAWREVDQWVACRLHSYRRDLKQKRGTVRRMGTHIFNTGNSDFQLKKSKFHDKDLNECIHSNKKQMKNTIIHVAGTIYLLTYFIF